MISSRGRSGADTTGRRSLPASSSFSLLFPADLAAEQVTTWLHSLSGLLPGGLVRLWGAPAIVLELRATAEQGFRYQLLSPRSQADYVVGQLRVAVPGIRMSPERDTATKPEWTRAVELGMRKMQRTLRVDPVPLAGSLLASLQGFSLRGRELITLQWIIRPAVPQRPPEQRASSRPIRLGPHLAVSQPIPAKDAVADKRLKLSSANFLVAFRIGVRAGSDERARQLLGGIRAALRSTGTSSNSLYARVRPQSRVRHALDEAKTPLLFPIQLTAQELAGLLAWPVGAPHVAGLPQSRSQHLPPSGTIPRRGLVVARSNFPGVEHPLAVSPADACKHLQIVGPTGVGKTVLAGNLVRQAIEDDAGVIVMERKGDLFHMALDAVPENRLDDVIVMVVGDTRPAGFNLLREGNPRIAVEELCQLFEYLYPDMRRGIWARAALHRGLSTLITRPGMTFIDLVPLLSPSACSDVEKQWRDELVASVDDPELTRFWQRFDELSPAKQDNYAAPILDRVWQLNERPEIRNIIGQSESSFSMRGVIKGRNILLVNLAGLGVETGRLTGTLLLNAIWSAVRAGAANPNRPTYLFLDEFQDFLNLPVDAESLLVQARSFGLALILAHQHLDQLPDSIRSAVMANARSKVVFQTTYDDARVFAREFGRMVSDEDFMSLGAYEVLCRLATGDGVSAPVSGVTLPPFEPLGLAEEARTRSRERYGRAVGDITADIAQRRTPRADAPPRKRPKLGGTTWE